MLEKDEQEEEEGEVVWVWRRRCPVFISRDRKTKR